MARSRCRPGNHQRCADCQHRLRRRQKRYQQEAGAEIGLPVSEDQAIKWLTINPAWALGLDDKIGSLEAGKNAEAVAKYEEALRISPDNKQANEGIKQARRAAVRAKLKDADDALSAAQYATALKEHYAADAQEEHGRRFHNRSRRSI